MSRSKKVQGLCDLSFLKICKLSVVQFSRSALSRWQLIYFSTFILLCQHFFQIFFRLILRQLKFSWLYCAFSSFPESLFRGALLSAWLYYHIHFLLSTLFFAFFDFFLMSVSASCIYSMISGVFRQKNSSKSSCFFPLSCAIIVTLFRKAANAPVAQWIEHRPPEPGA